MSEGPAVALKICRFDGDDRPFDTYVLVRRSARNLSRSCLVIASDTVTSQP
jgi:hypothetical protein